MKGCIPEANLEGQGWRTTLFTNLLVLTWGLRYFWKRGDIKKGCVEIEDWSFFVHFILGFQENFICTLHLYFSQDITKLCKVYTKTGSWFKKSHEEFGQFQTSSGRFKTLKFDELLCPKNTFVQKIHLSKKFIP